MKYETMDVCNMTFPDNFFDIAIDKSTIDALLCGDNSYVITALMLKESLRVIKEDAGVYFAISYGKPSSRAFHFQRPFLSWSLKQFVFYPENQESLSEKEIEEASHYIYVCTKEADWREQHKKHFEQELIRLVLLEKEQLEIKEDAEEPPEDQTQVNDILKAQAETIQKRSMSV